MLNMIMTKLERTVQVLPFLNVNPKLWGKVGKVLDETKADGNWVYKVEIDSEVYELPKYTLSNLT